MTRTHYSLLSLLLFLCAWCVCAPAWAQVQARLDRNPVDLGESVTLTLDNLPAGVTPDLTPLMVDFDLLDQSTSRSLVYSNGVSRSAVVFRIALAPKRAGNLQVPALTVGQQRSAAIALTVRPAPPVGSRENNADVFLETTVDDSAPYVQQSVGVVLRLFYAVPLVSGELDLDPPSNAMLQKVGEDVQGGREINGRRYNMVERRFLLVPERSGTLTLPAPRFRGRGAGGWFDDLMGGNGRDLSARGAARTLTVRAQPANAPQPWLPLRDLRLRYVGTPSAARVGETATLVIEGIAQGATQAQLPQLPVPSVSGAQVFPEPAQYDETFTDGSPQVKWTQRYAIVPDRDGVLSVRGLGMGWWDVAAAAPRQASLPELRLNVSPAAPGSAGANAQVAPPAAGRIGQSVAIGSANVAPAASGKNPWVWMTVGFAVLWLLTLLWFLRPRASAQASAAAHPTPASRPVAQRDANDLKRALDTGSLDDVAEVVRQMHAPPLRDLDAVMTQLEDADQRHAIDALRRARWADGDGPSARRALRQAFANGPRWKASHKASSEPLPPLYPAG